MVNSYGSARVFSIVKIKTVNLEQALPSVEQARAKLVAEIERARSAGFQLLKIIHGYGSHGIGGDLRFALQATLRQMTHAREITDCIYGENWRTGDERTWELLKRYSELKSDPDLGRGNRGITLVVL
jgi:hypothetical protein